MHPFPRQSESPIPAETLKEIRRTVNASPTTTLVSISGGSSTGKSTQLLRQLLEEFEGRTEVIQLDCMMGSTVDPEKTHPLYRWDHPDFYELDHIQKCITLLKAGAPVELPVCDFKTKKDIRTRRVNPARILILEGMYSDYGPLQGMADYTLYVEASTAIRLTRRCFRNMYERYSLPDPQKTIEGFFRSVIPAHRDFVRTQRSRADSILNIPYQFSDTLARFDCRVFPDPFPSAKTSWAEIQGAQLQLCASPEPRMQLIAENGQCYFDCSISNTCFQTIQQTNPNEL